jgi:hypothetical protein
MVKSCWSGKMNKRSLAAIAAMVTCILASGCIRYETGSSQTVPGCENAAQDGDETGVDCGGFCDVCEVIQKPDVFDWANCGQTETYPDLACQIDTSGDVLKYEVPIDANVDHIEVVIDPWDGHYQEPEHRPRAWITAVDAVTGEEFALCDREDVTDLPNYDKPHTLYLEINFVATAGTKYTVNVTGEHGKYSMNRLVVRRPVLVGPM